MQWILCKDKPPPQGVFWGFVPGRIECNDIRDDVVMLFIRDRNVDDIRTLDFAQRYVIEPYNGMRESEQIIAWMQLNDMILPEGFEINGS